MMGCTVFLDFDGVTHPDPCYPENVFCRMPLIEEVLFEFPRVEIVISSSWRDHHDLDDLQTFFSDSLKPRIVGVTPSIKRPSPAWLPGHIPQFEREWEIESWMEENRHWGARWLAIDDRPYWFRPESTNLLVTDPSYGFSIEDQVTLRSMIKERI